MANTEQVRELVSSLEEATLMAKQIGANVEQTQLLQIYSSLHSALRRLSVFLSAENSLSSADPMQLGEKEEEEEMNSAVDMVEEKMRECFIKKKRAKRPLSPSAAASEERVFREDGFGFDPLSTKLRALDLVYQFHA